MRKQRAPGTFEHVLLVALLLSCEVANAQQVCNIQPWLPDDYSVFHVRSYAGTTGLQQIVELDDSGQAVKKVDIIVNYLEKPVVLVLTGYDPIVWNVSWAPGSKIVGVVISGHHAPAIVGIPRWIPLLRTHFAQAKEPGACASIYNSVESKDDKAPWTKSFTGKEAEASQKATAGGPTWVGEKDPSVLPKIQTSDQYTIADFAIKRSPGELPAGRAGLNELIGKGYLRRGNIGDYWLSASPATILKRVAKWKLGVDLRRPRTFVALRKVKLPDGLYGADSGAFIVPHGVPKPSGPPGHNMYYVAAEGMRCDGPTCDDD